MKIRFIARTIIAILNLSRMSISWLPLPFPPQGLLAPLSSQEPMIWSTRKMPEEEIENVERVRTRGLYEHRRGREDGVRKIRKA